MTKLRWTTQAVEDVEAIRKFIANDRSARAPATMSTTPRGTLATSSHNTKPALGDCVPTRRLAIVFTFETTSSPMGPCAMATGLLRYRGRLLQGEAIARILSR